MELLNGYKINDRVFHISGRTNIEPGNSVKVQTYAEYNAFMDEHLKKFGRVKEIEEQVGHYIRPEKWDLYIEYERHGRDGY